MTPKQKAQELYDKMENSIFIEPEPTWEGQCKKCALTAVDEISTSHMNRALLTNLGGYDNKKLLVSKKRLSYKAIHLEFTLSEVINEHEIIIVAHNMGTVPPNTALLVLKDGDRRQELFITSTNKMNAKIIVSYTPTPKE